MLKKILTHKFVGALSLVSCLLSLSGFVWACFALQGVGNEAMPLILHFNDIQGITQVGGSGMIVFVGIFGILITALNGVIAFALDEREPFFGKLLAVLTFILSALLFIGFASIISVN